MILVETINNEVLLGHFEGEDFMGTVVKQGDIEPLGKFAIFPKEMIRGTYDKPIVITPDPTAPVFALAASNPLSQFVVEHYAEEISESYPDQTDLEDRVRAFAIKIYEWQKDNPDKLNNIPG